MFGLNGESGEAMKRILSLTVNPAIDESCSVETVFPDHSYQGANRIVRGKNMNKMEIGAELFDQWQREPGNGFSDFEPRSHCIPDYKESCFASTRGDVDDWRTGQPHHRTANLPGK